MFGYVLSLLLALAPILTGRITDSRGAPVQSAQIRAIGGDGQSVDTTTDDRGTFRLELNGRFYLEIRQSGYRTVRTDTFELSGNEDIYQVDISLLPGDSSDLEMVALRLEDVLGVQGSVEPSAREGLPKSDRLFGLRGGVNVSGIAEGSGQQWVAASGNVFTSSSVATSAVEAPDFSAELGDASAVDDTLPAGQDALHGDLHYFHRNDLFNARNFFDPPNQATPPFKYHYFGTRAGGRLKEQTYFHAQYWGLRINQSITRAARVPDPAWLEGDFSSLPGPLLDPETGLEFPGNRIPGWRVDPSGLTMARLYPAPNVTAADASTPNYRAVGKLSTAADAFGLRVDHRLSVADEIFMEYQFNRDTTEDPFNLLSGITNLPSFGARDALQTHSFRLHNTHVFSPNLIHQTRFSLNYLKQPRTVIGKQALPAVLITGLSNLGHAPNLPQERRNRSFELLNDFSWQGSTSVTKFGGTFRYFPFHAVLDLYSRGQFQFTGGIFSGHSFANLLLGVPSNALRIEGGSDRDFRTWTGSFYIQHDRAMLPRLSLNLGLRYDYQSPFSEAAGRIANFDSTAGRIVPSPGRLYRSDRNNWGPRIGLSWRPFNDMIVRAGYGIFYDTLAVGDSLFLLGLNPPFVRFDVKDNGPVLPRFYIDNAFVQAGTDTPPSLFSSSQQLPNPYVQQWSVSVAKPLWSDVVVDLSYLGQKGTRLRRQLNLNQPAPGPADTLNERRPYPEFRNIFQFETSASSIAHAAEVRAVRRFQNGLGFAASYRFSRSIDDATLISILPQNSLHLRGERGLSDFHMKHRLGFSATYNLPAIPLLGVWQIQAAGTRQSGMPLSAVVGTDISGTGSPIVNRPDLVGNPTVKNPTPARFFDPAAFRIPSEKRFGNSGRNVIIGPGIWNADLAATRIFRLTDSTRAQFRADAYNVFNHANFVAPPSVQNFADSSDFGALFVARSPRIFQFGLKFLW
jgi:hypothetical protein